MFRGDEQKVGLPRSSNESHLERLIEDFTRALCFHEFVQQGEKEATKTLVFTANRAHRHYPSIDPLGVGSFVAGEELLVGHSLAAGPGRSGGR
jgi:hypothetical protein